MVTKMRENTFLLEEEEADTKESQKRRMLKKWAFKNFQKFRSRFFKLVLLELKVDIFIKYIR